MKKFLIIPTLFLMFLIGIGNVYAYSTALQFDGDGATPGGYSYELIDTMHLITYNNYIVLQDTKPGAPLTELSNGDSFSESYTALVDYTKYSGSLASNYNNIYMDISLNGTIANFNPGADGVAGSAANPGAIKDDYFNVYFTGGSASLYYDDGVNTYDLATFTATGGSIYQFIPNPDLPVAPVTVQFEFDEIFDAAFLSDAGEDLSALVTKGWLLTMATGSVDLVDVTLVDEDTFGFEIQDNGFTGAFTIVPEPATMMLLGFGLLGLAGISRRKNS